MNIFGLMILMAVAFLLQYLIGCYQIKNFSKSFGQLRKLGRVAIGRYNGKIRAGVIVMFAIDSQGNIICAEKMEGVTVLAKFKKLKGFEGQNIADIKESDIKKFTLQTRKAILDAVSNYNIITNGGEIAEKPSPLKQLELSIKKRVNNN